MTRRSRFPPHFVPKFFSSSALDAPIGYDSLPSCEWSPPLLCKMYALKSGEPVGSWSHVRFACPLPYLDTNLAPFTSPFSFSFKKSFFLVVYAISPVFSAGLSIDVDSRSIRMLAVIYTSSFAYPSTPPLWGRDRVPSSPGTRFSSAILASSPR